MTSDRSPARVRGIRYLSAADVEAMAPSQQLLRDAVVRIFRAKAAQQTFHEPKLTMSIAPGHFFQSLVGASSDADRAMVKWVSIVAGNSGSGLPNVTAMIVLNDLETGQPLAILDGNWITAARTAAMTAVAASYLARVDSRAIGFVGCGVQAQSHLSALISALPGLARLRAYSRTRRSSEILAERARGAGLVAEVVETAQAAVEGCEVVVTSVPAQAGLEPFLDPAWVAPGGFVAAVDLGRSWLAGGLRAGFDILATDDHRQSGTLGAAGKLPYPGPFDADLCDLVMGRHPGRQRAEERVLFLFPGLVLGDLAIATMIYDRACAQDVGVKLPR
jgi:ornithine cyclodeaminase/alanine dehydrogenase-like protein (mu-crystallin family)